MNDPKHDCAVVTVCAASTHWKMEFDFVEGTATRHLPKPVVATPIAAETLAKLRAEAEAAHAGGDFLHREQFADGDTEVVITLGGTTVTLLYVTAGVSAFTRVQTLHDFACTCLRD